MAIKVARLLDEKSFLPNPSMIATVNGQLDGQPKTKDVFILSHPDILNLMRYVWAGSMLPTNRDDYVRRMGIDTSAMSVVGPEIDLMVKTYKEIATDNANFKDHTWSDMVTVADAIHYFATTAGGDNIEASYFAQLLESVKAYNDAKYATPQDKEGMAEARGDIVDFTTSLIAMTDKMRTDCSGIKTKINTFKTATQAHSLALKENDDAVTTMMKNAGVDVASLTAKLTKLQKELSDEQAEYEHDVTVAATTPSYAWCGAIGFIAAVSVAGVYGDRAVKMKHAIEATESEINDTEKKLQAAKTIGADSKRMATGVEAIIKIIDPAITTLEKLETVWQTLTDDLQGLQDQAQTDPDHIPGMRMERTAILNMMQHWNDFAVYVDQYRTNAYISEPEVLTLKEWLKKYGGEQ